MANEKIDALDKKILDIVTRNARIPSKNVAIECGVSRAAIHQRIQRLIELKVIQEAVSLIVFSVIVITVFKTETFRWNHIVAFLCIVAAVYFAFKK